MSILIRGATRCPLCGNAIEEGQEALSFPAFAWNEADSLLVFNDASVHTICFENDSRRRELEHALRELEASTGPGARRCAVCRTEITAPNDYILLPRLVDDDSDPLHRYNYTHLHKSHVPDWRDFEKVIALLRDLADSKWQGPSLRRLIAELEEARGSTR